MKTSRKIRTGALLLTTLMLIASCDLCTLFGLDYDPSTNDTTVDKPIEEETKDPGYFYTSGNTEDYLTIDAVELVPSEGKITAVSETGEEAVIELKDSKFRLGRVTITVTVEQDKSITLTRSDKNPLIYTYEE